MHNKVVYRIAKAFQESGFAVLRFNFRGTGRSKGEHAGGIGEQDDLLAAIRFVEERYPNSRLWLAGFSFGAAVMLRTCSRMNLEEMNRVAALVAAGTPASKYDLVGIESCDRPKLFVQGEHDQFGSPGDLRKYLEMVAEPKQIAIIEGADHFFEGRLNELGEVVSRFIHEVQETTVA
jgi:hypothetical protein